jgi:uncharacterized OB-fold protein
MAYFQHAPPPPQPNEEDEPFWRHVQQGRLHFQCCDDCGAYTHPPTLHCSRCSSPRRGWRPAPSCGTLFSFTVIYRASHRSVRDDLPYNVVLVSFAECDGVRLITNAADVAPSDLRIGMCLEVFIDGENESAVPRVKAVSG